MKEYPDSWIGVDLDGTLAWHGEWKGPTHIGAPIPPMVERVKAWRKEGMEVRIFTARADMPEALPAIRAWCLQHIGEELPITNVKDYKMAQLWDDRAVGVVTNLGWGFPPLETAHRLSELSEQIEESTDRIKDLEQVL